MSTARKFWSYQCEWDGCAKSFRSISTFEAHYRRHTDQRPYACDYRSCGEAFHDRGALNRHQPTHANERPFVCKFESCGQAFHDSDALDQHYHTHTVQSSFACKYDSCGQDFRDREKLFEHHRTHKQRPLTCRWDSCSRTFARREALEAHMHRHTRVRTFACAYEGCNKSFCDRGALIQHENGHASEVLPYGYESRNQTSTQPHQPHGHDHEEYRKTTTSVKEVRPTRLRLSQPKRQKLDSFEDSPQKHLLLRLPMKESLCGTSTPDSSAARKHQSELKDSAKINTNRIKRGIVHEDARPTDSSSSAGSSTGSTSKTSSKRHVSGHGSNLTPAAVPPISTSNVSLQALASQSATQSSPIQNNRYSPYTVGASSGQGTSVYTRVCGVYSEEKYPPKKVKTKGGRYHCPRCDTQFTRAHGVMRHFVGCIIKHGNPDSLKWTDHPSLQRTVKQATVKFFARVGHQGEEDGFLQQPANVRRNEEKSQKLLQDASLRYILPKSLSPIVEENSQSIEPVNKLPKRRALRHKDVIRPIKKRRDALRRSKYNPDTIARDVLLAMGDHPNMDPLNAHLDILRKRFKVVDLESNMSTFRWDLVDPEQGPEQEPAQGQEQDPEQGPEQEPEQKPRQEPGQELDQEPEQASEQEPKQRPEQKPEEEPERQVEPEQSASKPHGANGDSKEFEVSDVQGSYNAPPSLPARSSMKSGFLDNETPFSVISPGKTNFGPMSTIFSSVFNCDPSAWFVSSNGDLWPAIFTMLEHGYQEEDFVVRAAVRSDTGDVIGWIVCHEVDTLQARPENSSVYLDWTTAAHLLPSKTSRLTAMKESAEEKAERSNQRKLGQGLASTIQARATEAQHHLVPIRRLVINALVVHPLHQGRGVASALLKSITEIADMKKKPIWAQAPEDPAVAQGMLKAGVFRRAGFTCAGELNLDLDPYASGLREHNEGKGVTLGTYKWNYMLRWPHRVTQKPAAAPDNTSISLE